MNRIGFIAICASALQIASAQSHKTHRVVIELNVPGDRAYQTVLGNAEHLRKAFAPDPVDIEIVCEGEGIRLLFANGNRLKDRVANDNKAGVAFAACGNTVRAMHIDRKRLLPFVQVVDAGTAEVVRKQEAGWAYLKGAY